MLISERTALVTFALMSMKTKNAIPVHGGNMGEEWLVFDGESEGPKHVYERPVLDSLLEGGEELIVKALVQLG